jgi:hypothetical protein
LDDEEQHRRPRLGWCVLDAAQRQSGADHVAFRERVRDVLGGFNEPALKFAPTSLLVNRALFVGGEARLRLALERFQFELD